MNAKSKLQPKEPFQEPEVEEEEEPEEEEEDTSLKPVLSREEKLAIILKEAEKLKTDIAQAKRVKNPETKEDRLEELAQRTYDTAYDTYSLVYEFNPKIEKIVSNTDSLVANQKVPEPKAGYDYGFYLGIGNLLILLLVLIITLLK